MVKRRILVLMAVMALLGLCISGGYGQAQRTSQKPTTKKAQGGARSTVAVETLMPEQSVLFARIDGSLSHAEAYKQTAAYEALFKSGLMLAFEKTFLRAKGLAGPVPIKPYVDAIQQIVNQGFSLAVSPGMDELGPQPWGVVVFHEGASLDKVIASLVQLSSRGELKPERQTVEKRNISRIMIPDSPGVELAWWVEGKHLMLAFGINAATQAVAVANGDGPNVTTNPLWAKYSQSNETELTSFGWLDLVPVRAILGGMPIPPQSQDQEKQTTVNELLVILGLDNLNSVGFQSGIKDRSLTSHVSIDAPGERRGLLSILDQEVISLKDLPPLPQQLSSVMVASFNSAKAVQTVYQAAVDVEAVLSPGTAQVETARAQARDQLGLDVVDDLLAGLGDVTCFYNDQAQSGFGFAPAILIEVQDAEKLNSAFERLLVEMLPQLSNGQAKGVVTEKDGTKTYSIVSPVMGISPSLSVGEQWFCASLLPQAVTAFHMRQSGELPSWEVTTLPREASSAIPESFTSLTIVDPRASYRMILGLVPVAAGVAQAAIANSYQQLSPGENRPAPPVIFQASDFPPAELVTKPLYPNVAFTIVDENGLVTHTRSSIPGLPIPGGDGGAASVAVPAVLVALLLPAVQQAREAARRTQSKNNLKMIGLGSHNYADSFGHLPRGTVENGDLPVEERLSWMVSILPYVDEAPLYNQFNMQEGFMSEANQPLLENTIHVFTNPALGATGNSTHYVGIGGLTEEGPTAELPSSIAGVFGYDRVTRFQDISDGTSNTVMVAESQGTTGPWNQGGTATIRAFTQQPYINGPDGIGGPFRGGCQFLLCDGSVRFVSENIDPTVMEKLATIQGGELVDEF